MAATGGTAQPTRSPAEWGAATDAELIGEISARDEWALAEVFRRFGGDLHWQARRKVQSGDADDVVQEVMVQLWGDPGAFDPARGSLRTFLMMRCRGRALDLLRSEKARRAREQRATVDVRTEVCVESDVLASLDHHAAWSWLAVLSEVERHSIALAFFGGHTYREVAEVLGLPEGTVKSRIRSGLRRLHDTLVDGPPVAGAAG